MTGGATRGARGAAIVADRLSDAAAERRVAGYACAAAACGANVTSWRRLVMNSVLSIRP